MAELDTMKIPLKAHLLLKRTHSDAAQVSFAPHSIVVNGHEIGTFTDDEDAGLDADIARLEAHYAESTPTLVDALESFSDTLNATLTALFAPLGLLFAEAKTEPDTTYEHFKELTIHEGWHPLAACAYLRLDSERVSWVDGYLEHWRDEHGNVLHTERVNRRGDRT